MDDTSGHLRRLAPAVLLALLGVFLVVAVARPLLRPYAWSDFATFYSAAEAFADGQSPYTLSTLQDTGRDDFAGWIGRYLYPPPFAALVVRPLTILPFDGARRVWVGIEATAYLMALYLLAGVVFPRRDRLTLLVTATVGLLWSPFRLDLRLGSVSGILLLLLVVFLHALRRRQDVRAGLALGAAVLLKVSPAVVVVLLLLRGRTRVVLAALAGIVGLALVSLPASGLQSWTDYVTRVVPLLGTANFSWFTNQSLDALFWRLFMQNPDTTPWTESVALYRTLSVASSAVVLGVLGRWTWRRRSPREPDRSELVWLSCLGLVAALLVARVTWEYMTVLAIPCLLLWLQEILRRPSRPAWFWLLVCGFLCAAPLPYTQDPVRQGVGLLLESPRLWGLMILYVAGLRAMQRRVALSA